MRIKFREDLGQIWLATKERTQKYPVQAVRKLTSEPIEEAKGYHVVALHMGTTEKSICYLYWVPAQYVAAMKAKLGLW